MKKSLLLFIVLILFSNIHAADDIEENKISLRTTDTVEVGIQGYYYKYEEEVDGSFFMSNDGNKYGLSLTAVKAFSDDNYFIFDSRFATGDVEYNSASGKGDVSDDMYEIRAIVGEEVVIEDYLLSSYVGLGYRRLDNDLRDLGAGGYRRESEYIYIPIGVLHRFMLDESSRVSTTIEYDYFIEGEQKSYTSDVSPESAAFFGDQIHKQNDGYGIRLDIKYEEKNWSIGAFINYWKIDDSEKKFFPVTTGIQIVTMEPENETREIGMQLRYRF